MTALDPRVEIMLSTLHGRAWPHAFDATDQERMQRRMAEALFAADAEGGDVTKDELIAVIQDRTRDIISTNPLSNTSLLQQAADALAASVTVPEGWKITEYTRDNGDQVAGMEDDWRAMKCGHGWLSDRNREKIEFHSAEAAMAALDQEQG